jgi:hypothetical protein
LNTGGCDRKREEYRFDTQFINALPSCQCN